MHRPAQKKHLEKHPLKCSSSVSQVLRAITRKRKEAWMDQRTTTNVADEPVRLRSMPARSRCEERLERCTKPGTTQTGGSAAGRRRRQAPCARSASGSTATAPCAPEAPQRSARAPRRALRASPLRRSKPVPGSEPENSGPAAASSWEVAKRASNKTREIWC